MISLSTNQSCSRLRRLGLGLLLLALSACGLSDYETLMREAQQREERFRSEQKLLDEPVQIPTKPDKQGKAAPIANVFFRPPKGIAAKPEAESPRNDLLWRYPAQAKSGGDFVRVEMAFAANDEDFAKKVLDSYWAAENFSPPPHDPPLPFDTYEFNGTEPGAERDEHGYSINISKGAGMRVAIVYVFGKGRRDALRTAMDLSLQSLAVDQQSGIARQKYSQKSPWQLKPTPSP